jgi:hypothetical protein
MLENGPSAVDVTIISAAAGAIWTLYSHINNLRKERDIESDKMSDRITNIEANFMTTERFEELERRLYEGMTAISQRLDDILKSLLASGRHQV